MSRKKSRTPVQLAIISLRKRLGLTQRKLALALDVTVVTTCRWETSRPPSGASLAQLADFARSAGEAEIANIFNESFSQEFHVDVPRSPLKRLHWEAPGDAMNELHGGLWSYTSTLAEPYRELLKMLGSVHAMLIREAIVELQRSPSATQARTVLELQETHQLLQEQIKKHERP
jgi:transcriptional regulator with XRE-family HTH domain